MSDLDEMYTEVEEMWMASKCLIDGNISMSDKIMNQNKMIAYQEMLDLIDRFRLKAKEQNWQPHIKCYRCVAFDPHFKCCKYFKSCPFNDFDRFEEI